MESVKISVEELMKKAGKKFEDDFGVQGMHKFPTGLRGLGDRYIVPMLVAIGPYHHASDHLKKMEEVKCAAAFHLSNGWENKPPEEVYKAVLDVADHARKLYADHIVLTDREFAEMMFFDACFLLHYMKAFGSEELDRVHELLKLPLLFSNRDCIDKDIMLLENQLPWLVVRTIIESLPCQAKHEMKVAVGRFIARMGNEFEIVEVDDPIEPFDWADEPPHLLGFLRQYKTEGKAGNLNWPAYVHQISASSAIELAEIGIKLTASEKPLFIDNGGPTALQPQASAQAPLVNHKGSPLFTDMYFRERGPLCGELSLAPLSLNDTRARWLVNMAAFEVATVSSYSDDPESTSVSSYLALFSMFMLRKEDVHELRAKRVLHGDQTNAEMLTFFKSVTKHLPDDIGSRFSTIMAHIEYYKEQRSMRIKVHKFMYNNFRTIITVLTIVGTLVGIFQALLALNRSYQHNYNHIMY